MSTVWAQGAHRYSLGPVLGRGGMGVVFAAFDTLRGQDVAMKRLSCDGSEQQRARVTALFEREYHTLSQLTHPQIIEVYDYGIDDEGPYYTMELLSGDSLKTLAPLPWIDACRLVRDAASALAVLHSRRFVHRDVTPANIQLGGGGGAKLIDFGAMIPAGPSAQVVGTAPFVAPECLQLQALDARTDIYALGACLYYALTGRYPYPARSFAELPQAWKTRPRTVATSAGAVPEALERLVFDMLNLDVGKRPRGIGEVFERLTAIAGLPRVERAEVAQAYLINPELVGRARELDQVDRYVRRALGGQGRSLLVHGAAGVGRSRLLDAAAVEARLRGLLVARTHAGDGQRAPLGAARRLFGALFEQLPALAGQAQALGLAAFTAEQASPQLLDAREREQVIEAFGRGITAAAALRPLAIVVDDLDAIDEPSRACLASLAAQIRDHAILLVASARVRAGANDASALALLETQSRKLALTQLSDAEARAFLASLFGEVPNLELLAQLAHGACGGNPRQLMDGAQELVARTLARYEGGHWLLSSDPQALAAALAQPRDTSAMFARLSSDALDLLETLALDATSALGLADLPGLTAHGDSRRVNHALTELCAASVLTPLEDRFAFARAGLREAVIERMDEAARRARHLRLAERSASLGLPPVYETYHFVRAGELQRALPGMQAFAEFVERYPSADLVRNPIVLDSLEALVSAPEGALDRAVLANHGAGFIINAIYQGQPERAIAHAPRMLAVLSWFTGLSEYGAGDGEPGERLTRALAAAQARCAPTAGVLDPVRAIRRQAQLSITIAVCARFMADPALIDAIPDLSPYAPLSPAIDLVVRLIDAMAKVVHGSDFAAWDAVRAAHEKLRGPAADALDPLTRMSLEITALALLCSLEAEHGTDAAAGYIDAFAPAMPNLAESYRARFHFVRGDLAAAEAARRRFEVLSVQANSQSDARIVELPSYLTLYALAGDLLGLTRTLHALEQVTRTRPNWAARARLARGHVLRCRGDLPGALTHVERSLARIDPSHPDFAATAALHTSLLSQNGKHAAARAAGERHLAELSARNRPTHALELALAPACAELDDHEAAERCFRSALGALSARGVRGLHLRNCFEVGARIALRRGEHALYTERTRSAREHGAAFPRVAHEPAQTDTTAISTLLATAAGERARDVAFVTAVSRIGQGPDLAARLLELLCEYTGALGGALYVARGAQLERAASMGLGEIEGLDAEVAALHAREAGSAADVTACGADESTARGRTLCTRPESGGVLVPYSLLEPGRGALVAGLAVLAFDELEDAAVAHDWLSAIATALGDARAARTRASP